VQDKRLMERGIQIVRALPVRIGGRVGTDHVVVRQDVAETELLDASDVAADRPRIGRKLGLGYTPPICICPVYPPGRMVRPAGADSEAGQGG
jgi:hypothetical protein